MNNTLELRPEVQAFAQLMEQRLREKDAEKGNSWKKGVNPHPLMVHTITKCLQTEKAITLGWPATKHAVDMANYCMMIVDIEKTREAAIAERIEEGGAR